MSKETFELTGKELFHYGTAGQKWGIRKYQNPDGTYTEEGKRRYFGKPGGIADRITKSLKDGYGIRDNDNLGQKILKVGFTGGRIAAAQKAKDNAAKMGYKTSTGKEFVKQLFLNGVRGGSLSNDFYNKHRSEGKGRVESFLATVGDTYMNVFTLGKHGYDFKEKNNLEHSDNE